MKPLHACIGTFLCAVVVASTAAASPDRDGSRDFDFELGTWKTHVKRLDRPLSGGGAWIEYEGTSVVRPVAGGRANLVELDVAGPEGRIEGVSLRLYDPVAKQWSLNYASLRSGALSPPVTGAFVEGRGEFRGEETHHGRPVQVRFTIECESRDRCRFEQAFSADGGTTWETNWIATDTRVGAASAR